MDLRQRIQYMISPFEWPILVISKSFLPVFLYDLWANIDRFSVFSLFFAIAYFRFNVTSSAQSVAGQRQFKAKEKEEKIDSRINCFLKY